MKNTFKNWYTFIIEFQTTNCQWTYLELEYKYNVSVCYCQRGQEKSTIWEYYFSRGTWTLPKPGTEFIYFWTFDLIEKLDIKSYSKTLEYWLDSSWWLSVLWVRTWRKFKTFQKWLSKFSRDEGITLIFGGAKLFNSAKVGRVWIFEPFI